MENNNIDKTFNEASKTLEEPATFPGFDKVWAKVEEKLDKKEENKRRTTGLWILYGIAASLLIGSGIFYFTNKKENTVSSHQTIAQQTASSRNQAAEISVPIRRTDSTVKANIMEEILKSPNTKTAFRKVPEINVPDAVAPVWGMPLAQTFPQEIASASDDKVMMEKAERRNTEEIIAMGLRKEKASMVQELSATPPSKKKVPGLNTVADTAEAIYSNRSLAFRNDNQEPEILAYNKNGSFRNNLTASASGDGNKLTANRIGSKEASMIIRGKVSGVDINSISETPGSGKVDISISCQASSQLNNNPLFIIDGAVNTQEIFIKLDPKKIESMQVFKGEKATALFGNKAGNGVIVVETKGISAKEKRRLKKLLQEKPSPK
ncbi:TonB-dependent receptor plug domain-containing protein [Chryseobacterium sp. SN22]|uniref:TonB-dependent receptor plug domain-containing protein n=1 Tax=Chryseobacterium sp. SN22 TaxID=2606431 RepID=UPI0011EEAEDB|nr:TonB-dependent receptor plug domain-containing protein [Chryseobacterium sp. SN22]KAA0128442.1 TonB-dependent receptor plug domain-containing protein [Chryseobacterium sp. SN22]